MPKYILFLAKLKVEGRPLWNGKAYNYPMNYLLHGGLMLTIIKVFIILFLLVRIRKIWQFSKKISKLRFQLSFQVYSLLGQIEGCKKESHIVRLSPRALGCHKRGQSLSFGKIWNNPTPSLFFIRLPYK